MQWPHFSCHLAECCFHSHLFKIQGGPREALSGYLSWVGSIAASPTCCLQVAANHKKVGIKEGVRELKWPVSDGGWTEGIH